MSYENLASEFEKAISNSDLTYSSLNGHFYKEGRSGSISKQDALDTLQKDYNLSDELIDKYFTRQSDRQTWKNENPDLKTLQQEYQTNFRGDISEEKILEAFNDDGLSVKVSHNGTNTYRKGDGSIKRKDALDYLHQFVLGEEHAEDYVTGDKIRDLPVGYTPGLEETVEEEQGFFKKTGSFLKKVAYGTAAAAAGLAALYLGGVLPGCGENPEAAEPEDKTEMVEKIQKGAEEAPQLVQLEANLTEASDRCDTEGTEAEIAQVNYNNAQKAFKEIRSRYTDETDDPALDGQLAEALKNVKETREAYQKELGEYVDAQKAYDALLTGESDNILTDIDDALGVSHYFDKSILNEDEANEYGQANEEELGENPTYLAGNIAQINHEDLPQIKKGFEGIYNEGKIWVVDSYEAGKNGETSIEGNAKQTVDSAGRVGESLRKTGEDITVDWWDRAVNGKNKDGEEIGAFRRYGLNIVPVEGVAKGVYNLFNGGVSTVETVGNAAQTTYGIPQTVVVEGTSLIGGEKAGQVVKDVTDVPIQATDAAAHFAATSPKHLVKLTDQTLVVGNGGLKLIEDGLQGAYNGVIRKPTLELVIGLAGEQSREDVEAYGNAIFNAPLVVQSALTDATVFIGDNNAEVFASNTFNAGLEAVLNQNPEAFDSLDKDGNGTLTVGEFVTQLPVIQQFATDDNRGLFERIVETGLIIRAYNNVSGGSSSGGDSGTSNGGGIGQGHAPGIGN